MTSVTCLDTTEAAINHLDLQMVKMKLQDAKEGPGWSLEKAERIESWYKRFLVLNAKYPESPLVPTHDIDVFWHQHILDTRAYALDCQRIFGRFLHHFPYLGMRGPEDAEQLRRSFEATRNLFVCEFGENFSLSPDCSDCDSSACTGQPNCGSSCTGGRIS